MSANKEAGGAKSGSLFKVLGCVAILIVVGSLWYFGRLRLTSESDTNATAVLKESGYVCVQGMPAVESISCKGCGSPSKFSDAGLGQILTCRGGRVAYAAYIAPNKDVKITLAGGKPSIFFSFEEFDKPVVLGPAETLVTDESSTEQPGSNTVTGPTRDVRFTQPTRQAPAAQNTAVASESKSVSVALCKNTGFNPTCIRVQARAHGNWYCVANADLPQSHKIDYMQVGSNQIYGRLVTEDGFTCGGVRSP